ncbi:hypothetical protein K0M31_017921 [Melipona bicolor]|uniref:Uncharacterized protein n=1 Tax=Melipona bicolor TaxID=60889 RepID=A0AA40G618_9HYME|nr:hypothetical protein K0M31_017921 [Melipona bicolor]
MPGHVPGESRQRETKGEKLFFGESSVGRGRKRALCRTDLLTVIPFAIQRTERAERLNAQPGKIHVTGVVCVPQDWLPVGIRSWTPVYIEWSRSSKAGLNFRAAYEFIKDTYCGYHTTTKPEGEVNGGDLASSGLKLNQYYQQKCTWILDSLTDRQLTIEVKSTQSRPCTAWNLTIHEYSKNGDPAGPRLYTFCSRNTHKNFTLPWKTNTVVITGSGKDSTGIHDEMAEPVGNRKYAQERAIAGTESRAQLLSRKRATGNANPNSVRDAPRLRGRLLNGPTRQTVFVHVPVHNEKTKYCERA